MDNNSEIINGKKAVSTGNSNKIAHVRISVDNAWTPRQRQTLLVLQTNVIKRGEACISRVTKAEFAAILGCSDRWAIKAMKELGLKRHGIYRELPLIRGNHSEIGPRSPLLAVPDTALTVWAYLDKFTHLGGYNGHIDRIVDSLGLSRYQVEKSLTYLVRHGFIFRHSEPFSRATGKQSPSRYEVIESRRFEVCPEIEKRHAAFMNFEDRKGEQNCDQRVNFSSVEGEQNWGEGVNFSSVGGEQNWGSSSLTSTIISPIDSKIKIQQQTQGPEPVVVVDKFFGTGKEKIIDLDQETVRAALPVRSATVEADQPERLGALPLKTQGAFLAGLEKAFKFTSNDLALIRSELKRLEFPKGLNEKDLDSFARGMRAGTITHPAKYLLGTLREVSKAQKAMEPSASSGLARLVPLVPQPLPAEAGPDFFLSTACQAKTLPILDAHSAEESVTVNRANGWELLCEMPSHGEVAFLVPRCRALDKLQALGWVSCDRYGQVFSQSVTASQVLPVINFISDRPVERDAYRFASKVLENRWLEPWLRLPAEITEAQGLMVEVTRKVWDLKDNGANVSLDTIITKARELWANGCYLVDLEANQQAENWAREQNRIELEKNSPCNMPEIIF